MYKLRDLWGAAFLIAQGHSEPTLTPVEERPGLWEFGFEDTPAARACYQQFRTGDDTVSAQAYRRAVRLLKRKLAEQFHAFEDVRERR